MTQDQVDRISGKLFRPRMTHDGFFELTQKSAIKSHVSIVAAAETPDLLLQGVNFYLKNVTERLLRMEVIQGGKTA